MGKSLILLSFMILILSVAACQSKSQDLPEVAVSVVEINPTSTIAVGLIKEKQSNVSSSRLSKPTLSFAATPRPTVSTDTPTAVSPSKHVPAALRETESRSSKSDPPPQIEIGCPDRVSVGKELRCSYRHSGNVDKAIWGAPNGRIQESNEKTLVTRFDNIGKHVITLEACNGESCTSATHRIEVFENPKIEESDKRQDRLIETETKDRIFGSYPCADDNVNLFSSSIFPTDLISEIVPMGKMAGSHVTPTDHLYVKRKSPARNDDIYVVAPTDGSIVGIQRWPQDRIASWNSSAIIPDYRVVFMHSCSLFTIFIHLGELAPQILEKTGDIPLNTQWFAERSAPIMVKAGDPIAKFGETSFDWSVHDADTTLQGFVIPEHYETEPWKIHTVDPFKFYQGTLKNKLMSKVVRKVNPRAGKIDYDIEGTIVGNWFLDGTVNYKGKGSDNGYRDYWKAHLTIAYGYIDPSQIRISIGADVGISDSKHCNVCFGAYAVLGNKPDPQNVNSESGLVKYELMSRKGPNHEQVGDTSLGTFLVQHLGNRAIRVEVFPEISPYDVSAFSGSAMVYRR